jgi:hypothetical protein
MLRGGITMTWALVAAFAAGMVIGGTLGVFGMAVLAASQN